VWYSSAAIPTAPTLFAPLIVASVVQETCRDLDSGRRAL
jgi:hypothetical protein